MMHVSEPVQTLLQKGAVIHNPSSILIESSVDLKRISPEVTIYPGCRIRGNTTSIGPGTVIGEEGPVTISDCQISSNVSLKGGSFTGSVILSGVSFGPCAHVREGTLLEEHVSCAHSVGLKQTILMPYVTLGSLINFCDCLMAGGTDRKNHSEVGSSYIHFNYTPGQDKATASLVGDVPRGVMIDQKPIFLGGQGGLVGPVRIEYGTVIAAGMICRKDNLEPDMLIFGSSLHKSRALPYNPVIYGDITRTLINNFIYLGNLHALYHWYVHFRRQYMIKNPFDYACYEGAVRVLCLALDERLKHLSKLAENINHSLEAAKRKSGKKPSDGPHELQKKFAKKWPQLVAKLAYDKSEALAITLRRTFLKDVRNHTAASYLNTIKQIPPHIRKAGTSWLQSVVESIAAMRVC